MTTYKRALIGLDLSSESSKILVKAIEFCRALSIETIVAHIVEPVAFAYTGDVPVDISNVQQTIEDHAKERLEELINQANVNIDEQCIEVGQPAHELYQLAATKNADLIIIGSHEKHGLALLMGSTSSGVIHSSKCDVLALKV